MEQFEIDGGILKKYRGNSTSVIIPSGIITIGRNAFTGTNVREVVIPEGVITIDDYSFFMATELRKVAFPSSLQKIGFWAFGNCKNLATDYLKLSNSVFVDPYAFRGCCRRKYSSHPFEVRYSVYNEQHQTTIDIDLYDEQTLFDVLDSYIDDFIRDHFQDVIADALAEGGASMNETGLYEIYEVASDVYLPAEDYLNSIANEVSVSVVDDYADNTNPTIIHINIIEKLKKLLDDRQTCETWDIDVGNAISSDAVDFEMNGSWHFGFLSPSKDLVEPRDWPEPALEDNTAVWRMNGEALTPALWFGRSNDPRMSRWTITQYSTPEELNQWFLDTDEDIMDSLVDDFDAIATWYLYECDMDVPDLSKIIGSCPVFFEKNDDSSTIEEKICSFFLECYMKEKNGKQDSRV